VPLSLRPKIDLFDPANAASDTSDGTLWPEKWLTPEQVQQVFAECKRGNVDFKTNPNLVYRFCEALLSANANNPLWVSVGSSPPIMANLLRLGCRVTLIEL
jgi:hypothetical protein